MLITGKSGNNVALNCLDQRRPVVQRRVFDLAALQPAIAGRCESNAESRRAILPLRRKRAAIRRQWRNGGADAAPEPERDSICADHDQRLPNLIHAHLHPPQHIAFRDRPARQRRPHRMQHMDGRAGHRDRCPKHALPTPTMPRSRALSGRRMPVRSSRSRVESEPSINCIRPLNSRLKQLQPSRALRDLPAIQSPRTPPGHTTPRSSRLPVSFHLWKIISRSRDACALAMPNPTSVTMAPMSPTWL